MTDESGNIIMNAQQVSAYLRISLSTVHHLTRQGRLKSVKVGKQWRYLKSDIDAHLAKGFEMDNQRMEAVWYRGEERRAYPRFRCMIQGFASLNLSYDKTWAGEGNVINFSDGGILFETSEQIIYGQGMCDNVPVTVKLALDPKGAKEYELTGKVRHFSNDDRTRLGIQFNENMPQLTTEIKSFLDQN